MARIAAEHARGRHRGASGRTAQAAVGNRPLHGRADEDRSELNALAAAARTHAARVDLVAVVLVVGHPVDIIKHAVVTAQRVVVVVPEALPARLFGAIDIFALWWLALIAIGLSVLPARRARTYFVWFAAVYLGGAAIMAGVIAAVGGI